MKISSLHSRPQTNPGMDTFSTTRVEVLHMPDEVWGRDCCSRQPPVLPCCSRQPPVLPCCSRRPPVLPCCSRRPPVLPCCSRRPPVLPCCSRRPPVLPCCSRQPGITLLLPATSDVAHTIRFLFINKYYYFTFMAEQRDGYY